MRQTAFLIKAPKVVDQVLGAANGKGGDQHVAAIAVGGLQYGGQLIEGVFAGAMVAVAVGRLEHQHIGLGQNARVAHQWRAGIAQVAGKYQAPLQVVILDQ